MLKEEAIRREARKLIPTRWFDVSKGSVAQPNYRSRLVAKEIAYTVCDGLCAPIPSMEAFRLLLSRLATKGTYKDGKLAVMDISRAFFYAPMKRDMWITLPEEDPMAGQEYV